MPMYLPTSGLPPYSLLTSDHCLSQTLPPVKNVSVPSQTLQQLPGCCVEDRACPALRVDEYNTAYGCAVRAVRVATRRTLTDLGGLRSQKHDEVDRHCDQVAVLGILEVDVSFDLALLGELLTLLRLEVALRGDQQTNDPG